MVGRAGAGLPAADLEESASGGTVVAEGVPATDIVGGDIREVQLAR